MALGLVLIGAGLMLHSHFGMRDLAAGRVTLAEGEWRMNRYNSYSTRSRVGGAFIAAGAIVAVWALVRLQTDRTPEPHAEENRP